MTGRFITLEGIEGTGKSTQATRLCEHLRRRGIDTLLTREPGGTELGEKIRDILLSKTSEKMCDSSELLLMFAARVQHLQQKIQPALDEGVWVICDRFIDATYAYQGYGRGIASDTIDLLANWVLRDVRIDLTLLFDMPVAQASQRVRTRGDTDRFEQEAQVFFEKVRQGYLCIAEKNKSRVRIINAGNELEQVTQQVLAIVDSLNE